MKNLFFLSGLLAISSVVSATGTMKAFDGYVLKPKVGKMRITVVLLAPQESKQALVYFQGTGSPWDDQVILHNIEQGGKVFSAPYAGKTKNTIIFDQDRGVFTVYPPRYYGDGLLVRQDDEATKALDLGSIVEKYKSQVK
jgi:hypothetical protein